jgi:hypothetical protein
MVKKNQKQIPASLQPWIDARRRFHLSHEHVQMARELGSAAGRQDPRNMFATDVYASPRPRTNIATRSRLISLCIPNSRPRSQRRDLAT